MARPLLVILAVALAGCYEEPVATGERLPLDEKLLREWTCTSAESPDEKAHLAVFRFDETQYYVEWSEREGKPDRYRGYAARLRGVVVVNLQDIEEATAGPTSIGGRRWWTALRADLQKDGALSIQAPAKKILDMKDDKAALAELRATADRPTAWQPFARCVRPAK